MAFPFATHSGNIALGRIVGFCVLRRIGILRWEEENYGGARGPQTSELVARSVVVRRNRNMVFVCASSTPYVTGEACWDILQTADRTQ